MPAHWEQHAFSGHLKSPSPSSWVLQLTVSGFEERLEGSFTSYTKMRYKRQHYDDNMIQHGTQLDE